MKPRFLTTLTFLILAPTLQAQESSSSSLWGMIQQGGWAMYPLAACSLALIYISIHCFRETRANNFAPPSLTRELEQQLASGDLPSAQRTAGTSSTVLGRSLANALPKLSNSDTAERLEKFEDEMSSRLSTEENAIAQWIHYLSVVANVAPMIGLLGTVSGMIGGFQTMASGGMGRPELFAGDIGEALITTATGLCLGIPAMVAHSILNNRLQTAMEQTIRKAGDLAETYSEHN
ncbi:MotA/TolQ/ExbB proton channel family protein [Pelagicoccus albus]|uniref:MotA/TolQ/ExbB proton channel family protein n=1 Tax=Pelagicoccus albus TaxID=415222 RepID=A0A7X1B7R2_9BACT|nr:MotA/TolQ/ExbB proton channel family protein [Pelagicoccus albus]MBC2607097.1 MotA/TolQ/ExbB proton channel family protein [Pelagicoccus albus]